MNKSTPFDIERQSKILNMALFSPLYLRAQFIQEDKWRVTAADNLKTMTTSFVNFFLVIMKVGTEMETS